MKDFKTLSKISLITFVLALVLFILYFVFKNNKLPQLAEAGIQISAISYIVLIFNYIKTFRHYSKILKTLNKTKETLLFKILGFILYPIIHVNRNLKINS